MEDTRLSRVPGDTLTVNTDVTDNRVRVDERMVQEWAEDTLYEWFTGYTGHGEGQPQYKVTHVGEDKFQVAATYPDHATPRMFQVKVSVDEL